jgi:hypothetical protein
MNRFLITVVLVLLVGVVAVGFYRGWFTLSSRSPEAGSNKVNVNLTMDGDKMQADAQTVKDQAAELTGKVTEEVKGPGDRPADKAESIDR